jgi:hypothetical protein
MRGKLSEKDEEMRSMKEELTSMRSQMNDILEVLKIAKSHNGMVGKDRTMLDENRRVTFGYVDNNNQIVEVKIPLDGVQIDEPMSDHITRLKHSKNMSDHSTPSSSHSN